MRWLPFFSPHENLILCYSVAAETTVVYNIHSTHRAAFLHQLPPKTSGRLVLECLFPSRSLFLYISSSALSLKKSLLMMVASKKKGISHQTTVTVAWAVLPPGGERRVLGEDWREASHWSKPLLWPHRDPEKSSQEESEEMDKEIIQKISGLPVWNSTLTLLIHIKTRGCLFPPLLWDEK